MGAPSALVMRDAHAPCRIPTRLFAVLEARAFSRRRGHGFLTFTLAPESERRLYPHARRAWDIWVGKLLTEKHASKFTSSALTLFGCDCLPLGVVALVVALAVVFAA